GSEHGEPPLLEKGEELFGTSRAPLLSALDAGGGKAGLLLVPAASGEVEHRWLHWDGTRWTSEPIAIPAPSAHSFRVLGIDASSPQNAWLLGQLAAGPYPKGAVALF